MVAQAKILVSSDRKAKIADFGFANFANTFMYDIAIRVDIPRWMAPELLDLDKEFRRTAENDIFAFACIAFEVTLQQFFADAQERLTFYN